MLLCSTFFIGLGEWNRLSPEHLLRFTTHYGLCWMKKQNSLEQGLQTFPFLTFSTSLSELYTSKHLLCWVATNSPLIPPSPSVYHWEKNRKEIGSYFGVCLKFLSFLFQTSTAAPLGRGFRMHLPLVLVPALPYLGFPPIDSRCLSAGNHLPLFLTALGFKWSLSAGVFTFLLLGPKPLSALMLQSIIGSKVVTGFFNCPHPSVCSSSHHISSSSWRDRLPSKVVVPIF